MENLFEAYVPPGFSTISPYLFIHHAASYLQFLQTAFAAKELQRTTDPETGRIKNMILQIGRSNFMVAEVEAPSTITQSAFYLYVSDADQVFQKAIAAGAKVVYPVADMDYGDRQGGIQDPLGNYWWISQRLIEKDY